MAVTKIEQIQHWLNENNLTMAQVEAMWKECVEVNSKCKALEQAGRSWKQLPMEQIRKIPTLKEETLRKRAEKQGRLSIPRPLEEEFKQPERSYEEEILYKIDNKIPFSDRELSELRDYEISRTVGDNRRWSRSVESILEINGRHFCLDWEEGLTECQENDFYEQPYEVQKHEYEKVIKVTEWLRM